MDTRKPTSTALTILQCPVMRKEQKNTENSASNKYKFLIFGLFVGLSYKYKGRLSFSILSKVTAAIFAGYLTYNYLKKKPHPSTFHKHTLKDTGFFGPASITWQTGVDPSMIIAGIAAGLLQMLHPNVVRLIEESGKFYRDREARAENTGLHARSIFYGDKETAERAADAFKKLHNLLIAKNLRGEVEYSASKPELLLWVHNSLVWMILRTFKLYGPSLTPEQENQYIMEQHIAAKLAGLDTTTVATNTKELNEYMDSMLNKLVLNEQSIRFRDFLLKKQCPLSLSAIFGNLFASAAKRMMLPIHKEKFNIKTSKLSDYTVETLTGIVIRILRYGYPAAKMIPKAREELAERSFGGVSM